MNASRMFLLSAFAMFLLGCTPTFTIKELRAMKPQRPPELDLLNAFVGEWECRGEGTIAGSNEPVRFSGIRESQWEGNGWYLSTREVGRAEGMGESRTLIVWSYDTRAKRFRTMYVDTMGTNAIGTARYDRKSRVWRLRATSRGPGGTTSARGHVSFADPDTMNWDWTEHSMGGLKKTMQLAGVCRRKQ